ncbi:hypothetical protein QCA50_004232 [Cerrena zonata]|uniref:Ribosomal RNA-processing protein 12-like conserved domain-containing protein n=1 Tax=Cerrena zonata TaxID=2478898 RepID=A0AAW0GND8_9APHY
MSDNLDEALAKIRPHTSSNLPHQKAPAKLLIALESTFTEQNTQKTPTAYFAALLTTLDSTLQAARSSGPELGDGDVLPAELYLLALVSPYVPHPVIRSHLSTILSLTAPLFSALVPHAPPLRSQLSLYEAVLRSLDRSQLETHGLRQAFESILHLCLDPRPKVRKRAAEIVKDVMANPPPPSLQHPYAERVVDWIKTALNEVTSGGLPKFKGKKADNEGSETAIHLLAFLRPVLPSLPPSHLPTITSSLLTLPRLGNPYLSQSAYSILADLLLISVESPTNNIQDRLPEIIDAILSSQPLKADSSLISAWASVLGHGMFAYHNVDAEAASKKLWEVWHAVWPFMESTDTSVRKAVAQSLDSLAECFTPSLVSAAAKEKDSNESKSTLKRIISQTEKAFDSLAFARYTPELLLVISSLISNLRFRSSGRTSPTAAEELLLPLIKKIAEMRVQKSFEYKETADATLSVAMSVLGPEVLLRELPLNLDVADRQAGREPRAFLLPMLSQPHPSPLSYFVSYFVPFTERMFDLHAKADAEGRSSEAKVWSVLVDQVWSGLHGYCYGTPDLKDALTQQFSQLLSELLYNQPDLRTPVLKALRVMVESNVALASGDSERIAKLSEAARADPISQEAAAENVAFLRTQCESWLAVLFNVFTSAGRNGQGMVGDVISAWASISDEKEIGKAYRNLVTLLKQNINKAQKAHGTPAAKEAENVTAMALDLLILMLSYLSSSDATALFEICLTGDILESRDNAVQKRGYKVLAKLVESDKVDVNVEDILKRLDTVVDGLAAAAKKDRIVLLTLLMNRIPPASLHLIPSLIPEAVLGTKEPSEKARNAAFDLIVAMGKKMTEGGVVKRSLVDGMEEDADTEAPADAKASIEEYMTMVAGGLAGASPHMISASVTAISRLVFEFRDAISPTMHTEIFSTLLVFLSSANREIVKSTLGYVKLAIHTMPVELLRPHLKQLVPALLSWSHDHKNHFKAKVRHIFERTIRRFGWEDVYSWLRGKKARATENDDDDDEEPKAKPTAGDAFEDVLYGSESELDDSDDEPSAQQERSGKRKDTGARLRVDDDEPMDLLAGAASRITNANGKKRRKPGEDAARFKIDEGTGKMVIDEKGDEDEQMEEDVAGTAYRESLTSVDGFTRGPNGRVKFNKDTKKRRRDNEDEDVEMVDAEATSGKKAKRKTDAKFGHEFKAKKAGGDVKKGGVDPYAYLPLSQAAKKKGRKDKLGVAGKR